MAKRRPAPTLVEMEQKLGYTIDSLNYLDGDVKRFYSDLRPVPNSVYEKTRKEFDEYEKQRFCKDDQPIQDKFLPNFDVPQTITHCQDTVRFTCRSHIGFYNFAVDIHYGFGLHLPLLFTKNEAFRAITVPKSQSDTTRVLVPMFFKLPKEIRDKIYVFALPVGGWKIGDVDCFNELNFARSIGDPSGFYFPLSSLAVLRVNRQMRQEALPFAYRSTVFHTDDMDDLIKLLVAVGDIGRDNIESLELGWQSRSDFECQWDEASVINEYSLTFPTLHVEKCVLLLKQCKRLRFLRLLFESDLVLGMTPEIYKADPGIHGLCSVRGVKKIQIWDLGYKPLQQCGFLKWLKEAMESSGDGEGETGGVNKQRVIDEEAVE